MQGNDTILILIVQLGVILALSRIMGWIFRHLRQPQVMGEMVAGIMLGPSLLGWLAPQWQAELFPAGGMQLLRVLSELGVVFFLFLIGLEFQPALIRKHGRAAVLISGASITASFVVGMLVTAALYGRLFNDPQHRHWLASLLFMGTAFSVTAFPVLARILTERNLQQSSAGAVSLTAAAIVDASAWCILALVAAVAHYEQSSAGVAAPMMVLLAVAYVAGMFIVVRPLLRKLQQIFDRQGRLSENVVAVIFLLLLGSSYLTSRIGIHALFGAFLLGCVMPKGTRFVHELSVKMQDITVVFLLPLFFASAGLRADVRQILVGGMWGYAAMLVLIAGATKIISAAGAARACGMTRRESAAVGVLMNTRGLMDLIVLSVGLSLNVIDDAVYAMMVIMALVTTAMTSPILDKVFPAKLPGMAPAERKGLLILIPVSLPESGTALAHLAATIIAGDAGHAVGLNLRRASDREAYQSGLDEEETMLAPLTPLLAEATKHKLSVEPVSFVTRDIAADIAAVAQGRSVDLVLMGFHKPVFSRTILGGTVHRVLSECPANVAILVDRGFEQTRRILVPFMGSSHDRLAIELTSRIGRSLHAQITVLHIVHPSGEQPKLGARNQIEKILNDPTQSAAVNFRVVESDSPLNAVVRESLNFDLVVVGMEEQWGLESRLIGLRPERIAREFPGSLLIVRTAPGVKGAFFSQQSVVEGATTGSA